MPDPARPRYVFICSAGHSGSTLLDLLIGGNRAVESLGEITHFPKNIALNTICTCGVPVRECALWSQVIAELSREMSASLVANPYRLDLGFIDTRVVIDNAHQTSWYRLRWKFLLGCYYLSLRSALPCLPGVARHLDRVVDNSRRLYEVVLKFRKKSVVVDSSKSYLKAIAFYRRYPAATRIIALARDGRGVFYSGLSRGARPRAAFGAWANHYQRALPLYEKYVAPEHVIFVRYESLASSPGPVLQRICEFLDLEYDEAMLQLSDTESHIADGNDMRFARGPIRLDEKWRTALSAHDTRYFNSRGSRLNAMLGYE